MANTGSRTIHDFLSRLSLFWKTGTAWLRSRCFSKKGRQNKNACACAVSFYHAEKTISLQSIKLKHYHVCLCFAKPSWSWSSTGREFQCPSGTPLPKDLQSSPQGLWGPFCYTCHRLHVSAFWLGLFLNCLCSDWPNIITLGLINGWYVITILFLKKAFT